jgi:hypothetical protein
MRIWIFRDVPVLANLLKLLIVFVLLNSSDRAFGQNETAEDLQAVTAWSLQRYASFEQVAYVPVRLQSTLQATNSISDRGNISAADVRIIDLAIADIQADRQLLIDTFDRLPPPPALRDAEMYRRLSDSVPLVERAVFNGRIQYDAAIGWLVALREGCDPEPDELALALADAQISYLEAMIDLFDLTGSQDLSNPGTLDAMQRTAMQFAQRAVLILDRADLVGEWNAGLLENLDQNFAGIRQVVTFTSTEISVRASESVRELDEVIEADPLVFEGFRAYRNKIAEIAETYSLVPAAGQNLLFAMEEFRDRYGAATSREERQLISQTFMSSLREIALQQNIVKTRRNQLFREATRLANEL